MHNHVGHRWIKTFLTKIISILLVYSLFFTNSANASSVGGWSMGNPIAQGASTIYEGSKNVIINGADYVKKGAATITPSASNVAKTLGKGVAGVAVSVAVEQLLGAVDWVLDPANNRVVYYESTKPDIAQPYDEYFYHNGSDGVRYSSPNPACQALLKNPNYTSYTASLVSNTRCNLYYSDGSLFTYFSIYIAQNPAYDPAVEEEREEKSIPLDTVVQQVISNAEAGDTNAQAATTAAAADIVAEAETDSVKARPIAQQLEASASTKPADATVAAQANTATGESVANPETGASDLKIDFPVFCNWAPSVCEAAQVVTSLSSEAWTAAKDWAKNDENQDTDNDPPEIKEIDIEALDTSTFTGVAGCPAPIVVPISFGDGGETEISYEPICQLAEKWSFVAPLIGFLSGAMIIVGVGRKGEDGEI